jgi:hypothetical protein
MQQSLSNIGVTLLKNNRVVETYTYWKIEGEGACEYEYSLKPELCVPSLTTKIHNSMCKRITFSD